MSMARIAAGIVPIGLLVLAPGVACSQDYPTKSIRIVTAEPGGGNDQISRVIAQGISGALGQPVIVDNRAGNFVMGAILAKAQPDGYTLLVTSNAFWYGPLLESGSPYDPIKDIAPITWATSAPILLVVHPSVAANSVKELIALAKAKPGELNYASSTTGTQAHLAGEMFKIMAGVNVVRVTYKGNGPALTAMVAGQMQMMFPNAAGVTPHIKSGKLKALAVASAQPSTLFPDLPTITSSLPGFEAVSMAGAFAPARTPAPLINRLNQEIVRFLKTAAAKERFLSVGTETVASSPGEFGAAIKADMARVSKLIKDAGIRAD